MMLKKILIVLIFSISSLCNAYATDFDTLQKHLRQEVKKNELSLNANNSSIRKQTNNAKNTKIPEYSIKDGLHTYSYDYWDDFSTINKIDEINNDIQKKCLFTTEKENPLVVEFRILFKQSEVKNIVITKSSGEKSIDNQIITTLKKFFKGKNYGVLNNGSAFYFSGRLVTIPHNSFSLVFVLDAIEENVVPEKNKEYCAKVKNLLDDKFKNKANINEEVVFFFKISKNGELLSLNQNELVSEFNKIYSANLVEKEITRELQDEIVQIIKEITPLEPIDIEYNQVIFVKVFKAEKKPFIKPTDKLITKIGKGTVVGVGYVVKTLFGF